MNIAPRVRAALALSGPLRPCRRPGRCGRRDSSRRGRRPSPAGELRQRDLGRPPADDADLRQLHSPVLLPPARHSRPLDSSFPLYIPDTTQFVTHRSARCTSRSRPRRGWAELSGASSVNYTGTALTRSPSLDASATAPTTQSVAHMTWLRSAVERVLPGSGVLLVPIPAVRRSDHLPGHIRRRTRHPASSTCSTSWSTTWKSGTEACHPPLSPAFADTSTRATVPSFAWL